MAPLMLSVSGAAAAQGERLLILKLGYFDTPRSYVCTKSNKRR